MSGVRIRRRGLVVSVIVATVAAVLLPWTSAAPAPSAEAANASQFRPGNIISDANFYAGLSMTPNQVQEFLVAKRPSCDAGYTCLPGYGQATPTMAANRYCTGYDGSGYENAATIIARVGIACNVNPRVLLVLLEKEQSLVSDRNPAARQFERATGFACPDTAPCDASYGGFFYQVYYAARQFQVYRAFPGSYNHQPAAWNNVLFHPNSACGSSRVFIENQATAGLYNYTPYQPNAAALANLYGTGDSCSSYGNRNFWRIFSDWFGPSADNGVQEMQALYVSLGGASGILGAATSDVMSIAGTTGSGYGVAYANGSIYWSAATGARYVTGAIMTRYFAAGGATGSLGWPTSSPASVATGTSQAFQGGSVYQPVGGGAYLVRGAILERYHAWGGSAGLLGWPVAEQSSEAANGGGVAQAFQGGSAYSAAGASAQIVRGAVRDRFFAVGSVSGSLGWPIGPESGIGGRGVGQAFQLGSIYGSAAGAYSVSGRIRDAFFASGAATGLVGWPIAEPTCAAGGSECSQAFEQRVIVADAAGRSWTTSAAILDAHRRAGGVATIGSAATDLVSYAVNGGGSAQVFANASVFASTPGAFAVSGAVRQHYFSVGGAAGRLGWPTSDVRCSSGACTQAFQGGTISTTASGVASDSAVTSVAQVVAAQGAQLGAERSSLALILAATPGAGQAFANGSVYASTHGTFSVSGTIRDRYFRSGGAVGPIGWPTAAVVTWPGGQRSQAFTGGTIYTTSASTAVLVPQIAQTAYAAAGGPGVFGYPSTEVLPISGAQPGFGLVAGIGSIYWRADATTAHVVSGGIRDFYFARGGATGSLGWPTSVMTCSGPQCTQSFQGGTVVWDATNGGRLR